jgi:pyruvate formate lyase activating enzyme
MVPRRAVESTMQGFFGTRVLRSGRGGLIFLLRALDFKVKILYVVLATIETTTYTGKFGEKEDASMKIAGLQKLTLLDYPGKVACTVFASGCNFRCPFCHNAALVLPERKQADIPESDVIAFLRKRAGLLEGVCLSGGEPLLQQGIRAFLRRIKELGYFVKLDTNGSRPELLGCLMEEGLLDYVAMDIKNTPSKYALTAGVPGMDTAPVIQSAELLMCGRIPYEFRTTVVREFHTRDDLVDIGRWLKGAQRYFLQGFVDSGDLIASGLHPAEPEELARAIQLLKPFFNETALRGV